MVYVIRELRARDIFALDKMYDSLSNRSKRFLSVGYLGLESIGRAWCVVHVALFLSSVGAVRRILIRFFPYGVFLSLVAINKQGNAVAFSFVKLKGRLKCGLLLAELVICVKDEYQRRGIGSKLMERTLVLASRENVKRIFLKTLKDNIDAIGLFQRFGFKAKHFSSEETFCHGLGYGFVGMLMNLDKGRTEDKK